MLRSCRSQGINGPITPPIVPACDGAGEVEAVGSSVKGFGLGDRVVTHVVPKLAESSGDDCPATIADVPAMMGQGTDGTLRSMGVFTETALVRAPKSLEWLPAATLSCTWTTAWNILFGVEGREVKPDSWVLVQGTGGVSIATLQLAVAAGANVVATSSSEAKAIRLRSLGAVHTVDYKMNAEGWGTEARNFTPDGRGFDFVADVGGYETLPQSLATVRCDGIVSVIGGLGDPSAEVVGLFAVVFSSCIVRGILGGTRGHFKKLVEYIDEHNIKPAVDDVVFELADAMDAYRRLKEKKHFSKVLIRIDH